MREINWDKASELEKSFYVGASEPNEYGTVAKYIIQFPLDKENYPARYIELDFQDGNPSNGVNGIIDEVLLAILIDRARNWQNGPLSTRENSIALTKLEEALMWKRKRVVDRINRNVIGTYKE